MSLPSFSLSLISNFILNSPNVAPSAAGCPLLPAKPFTPRQDEGLLYLSGTGRLINQRQLAGGRLRLSGRPVWGSLSADPLQDEASVSQDSRRPRGLGELIRNDASALGRVPVQASPLAKSIPFGKFLRNFSSNRSARLRVARDKCLPRRVCASLRAIRRRRRPSSAQKVNFFYFAEESLFEFPSSRRCQNKLESNRRPGGAESALTPVQRG